MRFFLRRTERSIDRSHITVRDWFHRFAHLFETVRDRLPTVAIDETKLDIKDWEAYVWTVTDVNSFKILYNGVSVGRSSLAASLFLSEALNTTVVGHRLGLADGTTGHSISWSTTTAARRRETAH